LKGILKDRELESINEIEESITEIWNGLTFDGAQSVVLSWMKRLARVIENGGEHIRE
jgi:hypothetical protein